MDIDFDQLWLKNAHQPAILSGNMQITYTELRNAVINKIDEFKKSGIHAHDRIALIGSPGPRFVINLLACFHRGIIAVPLSNRYSIAQREQILSRLQIQVVLTDEKEDKRKIQHIGFGGVDLSTPSTKLPSIPLPRAVTILMTSGSSGKPKAVLHTMANHYYSAQGAYENMPLKSDDRWLIALPIYHIGGLAIIFRTLLSGTSMVFPAEDQSLAEAIQLFTVSHVSLVPTQLKRLMDEKNDFSSLKAVLLGGASIPSDLIRLAAEHRIPVHTSYGSTEMASQVATSPAIAAESGARILNYRQVRISQDSEVLIRGATLSPGYISGNQITPLLDEDGWFHSGDLGKVNSDGNLIITGRKDTMFISGGENIFPEEIENHLLSHPDIARALVVAVPNEEFGERPVAFILNRTGRDLNDIVLKEYLKDKIEKYKIPDEFLPWPMGEIRLKNDRLGFKKIALNQLSE